MIKFKVAADEAVSMVEVCIPMILIPLGYEGGDIVAMSIDGSGCDFAYIGRGYEGKSLWANDEYSVVDCPKLEIGSLVNIRAGALFQDVIVDHIEELGRIMKFHTVLNVHHGDHNGKR